jgi:hypothetical protein
MRVRTWSSAMFELGARQSYPRIFLTFFRILAVVLFTNTLTLPVRAEDPQAAGENTDCLLIGTNPSSFEGRDWPSGQGPECVWQNRKRFRPIVLVDVHNEFLFPAFCLDASYCQSDRFPLVAATERQAYMTDYTITHYTTLGAFNSACAFQDCQVSFWKSNFDDTIKKRPEMTMCTQIVLVFSDTWQEQNFYTSISSVDQWSTKSSIVVKSRICDDLRLLAIPRGFVINFRDKE